MEKFSDVLRRLADLLDEDYKKNVEQVYRQLIHLIKYLEIETK